VPTAFEGHACTLWTEAGREATAREGVLSLGSRAKAVLCIGTCASFGGIPSGNPNPTGVMSVGQLTGRSTINIPGCPTHPDWIVWVIAQLLAGIMPVLDAQGRPADLLAGGGKKVHDRCPRKGTKEAKSFGLDGLCLKELGCKGPRTYADCPEREWNNGTNWCIGANAICLGCTEKGFPDSFSPLYKSPADSPGPQTDRVVIIQAKYSATKKTLTVAATSDAPAGAVQLTAVGFGLLKYDSKKGSYRAKFKGVASKPATVTVTSTGGGSATMAVS